MKNGPFAKKLGRPKKDFILSDACRAYGQEAFDRLVTLRKKAAYEGDMSTELEIIKLILDRGFGKAVQPNKDLVDQRSYKDMLDSLAI